MKKYRTDKEIVLDYQVTLFKLETGLKNKKYSISEIGDFLPGMLHFNRAEDLVLSYFNNWALNRFEKSVEEILAAGLDFMLSLYEEDTAMLFSQSLLTFVAKNDKQGSHGFFQKFRFNTKREYEWMYTSSKLFNDGEQVFSYSTPLEDLKKNNVFLLKNLEDNIFLRKNFQKLQSLTKREKQVLQLVARGYTSKQIAENLFLAEFTVSTHRKNIIRKLDIKTFSDWIRFANAFCL